MLGASVTLCGFFVLYFIIGACKKWRSFVRLQKLISVCRIVILFSLIFVFFWFYIRFDEMSCVFAVYFSWKCCSAEETRSCSHGTKGKKRIAYADQAFMQSGS